MNISHAPALGTLPAGWSSLYTEGLILAICGLDIMDLGALG